MPSERARDGAAASGPFAAMTARFGRVIRPNEEVRDLAALMDRPGTVQEQLRSSGAVLLRGFGFDLGAMEAFSARFGSRFIRHHATAVGKRAPVSETTATVNLGGRAFAWHRELGYAPFAPDLLFFLCERPARVGGETLLTDGCAIFDELSEPARAFASRAVVEYGYRLPREAWPLALEATSDAEAEAALSRMAERLAGAEALAWTVSDEGIKLRYRAPMLTAARWTGRPAFCNQVIFRARRIVLGDGGKLPGWLLREVQRGADANSYAVTWQAGDLALIDNSRVMHARGEIVDPERRILVRMCHVES